MHAQVKHARFNLIVCALTLTAAVAAYLLILSIAEPGQARGAFGLFGFLGLLGLGPTFYHKRPGRPRVVTDERDKQISDRATIVAWRVFWLYWCLVCMGPWVWIAVSRGLNALEAPLVPVEWLPWALMVAFVLFMMTWSVSVLASYRRGEPKADE
jgi:hypothetical protein